MRLIHSEKLIQKNNKQILNNEFKVHYYKFIYLLVHQDKIKDKQDLNLNAKLRLQLVYYLQL